MAEQMIEHVEVHLEPGGNSFGIRHWLPWKFAGGVGGFSNSAAAAAFAADLYPDLPIEHTR